MTTVYEWDIETCYINEDGEEEVHDHDHRDRLNEWPLEKLTNAICQAHTGEKLGDGTLLYARLVLVRDDWKRGGVRAWAYVDPARGLPDMMTDAYDKPVCKVPKRFHEEFAR